MTCAALNASESSSSNFSDDLKAAPSFGYSNDAQNSVLELNSVRHEVHAVQSLNVFNFADSLLRLKTGFKQKA